MPDSQYQIEALSRGLRVLSLFNREMPALTLTEITDAADLNKTTAFRVVSTLEAAGFLERDPDTKHYRPGIKVMQLGFTAISGLEFRQVARPHLIRLSQKVGRTVSLSVLDGMEVVYVDRVRVRQVLGVVLGLGSRIPAHCASLGKAMLAYLPPDDLERRLDGANLEVYTPNTIIDRKELKAELARVREQGYSVNDEEWVLGLRSTAAPVLDNNGGLVGALNTSVSAAEISRQELESTFSPAVRSAAQEISAALGHEPAGQR
jgi:PcaR/PcaU/PobR family beta-ketoadipate pathway transcriptional regulator